MEEEPKRIGEEGALAIAVIANEKAGTARGLSPGTLRPLLEEAAATLGATVAWLEAGADGDLEAEIEKLAARGDIDALLVAGGDGTVSAAAAAALRHDKLLCPLPFGTYNLFCRAVGIGTDLRAALARFGNLAPRRIDVGEVFGGDRKEGRIFLTHLSGGIHPRFVRLRDTLPYRSKIGKMLAGARAWFTVIRTVRRTPLAIVVDGRSHPRAAAGFAVTVGPLVEGQLAVPVPETPSSGILALYVTTVRRPQEMLRLLAEAAIGRWRTNRRIEADEGREITIASREPVLHCSIDGEVVAMPGEIRCIVRPGALRVLCASRNSRN